MKNYVILLATDDSAVEAVVKTMETSAGCELMSVKTSREVASMVMDGALTRSLGIVDLDLKDGARGLLSTMGGAIPVIAVTRKVSPWLSSMVDHHRIGAAVVKPVSTERMRAALLRVRQGAESEVYGES
ncbi:MAG: hypothetical protein ABJF10_25140 [Chthoniobacter sp.]|uniref:hypothetical protein n=1 Tax=Chthoniobacter sp. TaxID=2510640 RepID=UPI0032AA727A